MRPDIKRKSPFAKSHSKALASAYALYCDGMLMRDLAAQYGVTVQAISIAFKRAGLSARPRGRRPSIGVISRPN